MISEKSTAIKSAYFGIIVNSLLAFVKIFTGMLGNSYALIADGIESTTDIFASILVLVGIKYSTKPPDKNHPYGHGRAEPLFTFIVVGFLLVSATVIAFQSIVNIQTPHEIPAKFTLYILGGIIILKEISYRIVNRKSEETKSSVLKAEAWHHRSDAMTSVFAFVGITIAIYFGKGFEIADDIAALIASGFIVFNAYKIFRPALGEIMDEHLHHDMEEDIRQIGKSVVGVRDVEKCFIRKTGMTYQVDVHVVVKGDITVALGHHIGHQLKKELMHQRPEISEVLTHVEPDFEYP